MRRRVMGLSLVTAAFLAFARVAPAQTVTNVRAAQLPDGTKRVEILYDLSGAAVGGATVTVAISSDGGATFAITPVPGSLAGDVAGVASGANRRIVWDPAASVPAGTYGTNYRAAVTATNQNPQSGVLVLKRGGEPWIANLDGSGAERLAAVALNRETTVGRR